MWYDYQKVLSYNAMFNFIIGERGVGKTYGCTKYVINRYKKKKRKFVYLRRYKTELKESVPKFFDAINYNHEFDALKLHSSNNKFYANKKCIGYALPLSTANILKSSTFADVDTIIFDEFIIDKGCYHYLRNEVEQLLDIVETIGRLRDIKVFFLANNISITNPYFTYFNLNVPYNSDIALYKNNLILVNYIKNLEYRKIKKQSKFGKLIEGTQYAKYAIDNEALRDSKSFIGKKPNNAKFMFIISYKHETYGVWIDYINTRLYISKSYNPDCPVTFAMTNDDHNPNTTLLKIRRATFFKQVIEYYRNAQLYFENQKIKNNIMELIVKFLTY